MINVFNDYANDVNKNESNVNVTSNVIVDKSDFIVDR